MGHKNLTENQLFSAFESFVSNPLFGNSSGWLVDDNPFRRPLILPNWESLDFSRSLHPADYYCASSLTIHRLLCTIYHADLVFLPRQRPITEFQEDMRLFYSDEVRVSGHMLRPLLERYAFEFLETHGQIKSTLTATEFETYLRDLHSKAANTDSALVNAVLSCKNPEAAARSVLIQFSLDFLTEGSGLLRNLLGNYGPMQSDIFRILMDEYGNGCFARKHSTLYEKLMRAYDLNSQPNVYWQYYLTSSLLVTNYIQYVSSSHSKFFRFAGLLYYAETTYAYACAHLSNMLKRVFGPTAETEYFDEHAHVDFHHSNIALKHVILPLIERFGSAICGEILRGYEEFATILNLADQDLISQITFIDRFPHRPEHECDVGSVDIGCVPPLHLDLEEGESIGPRVLDTSLMIEIERGELEITVDPLKTICFQSGDSVFIPKGRMHGIRCVTDVDACERQFRS